MHGERRAQELVGLAHLKLERLSVAVDDALDEQILAVENDGLDVGLAIEGECRRTVKSATLEVGDQVERDVAHHGFTGACMRVNVVFHGGLR